MPNLMSGSQLTANARDHATTPLGWSATDGEQRDARLLPACDRVSCR
jgi:hypothetical protein